MSRERKQFIKLVSIPFIIIGGIIVYNIVKYGVFIYV